MKRAIPVALFVVLAAVAVWSQPKVAVLDAIIPKNMDPSVIIPVTEKIAERLVVSGRFTVLDRANIESVLKEREFQVSGMVSDQDVVTAGKYLGADFVVVAKVTKVSDTYFISAKMIAIKTGVIANQTSAQGEGKLSELITLAERVGEVLSGGAVLAQSAAGGQKDISKPEQPPAKETKPKAAESMAPTGSTGFLGGGAYFSLDVWDVKAADASSYYKYTESRSWDLGSVALTYSGKYFQIGLGYTASVAAKYTWSNTFSGLSSSGDITDKLSFLAITAYAKYPVKVGSVTVFPLGGVEYDLNLTYTDSSGNDLKKSFESVYPGSLDHLYLQIGAGAEFEVGSLVIYPELIYGWRMPTKYDTDYQSYLTSTMGWATATVGETKLDLGVIVGIRL